MIQFKQYPIISRINEYCGARKKVLIFNILYSDESKTINGIKFYSSNVKYELFHTFNFTSKFTVEVKTRKIKFPFKLQDNFYFILHTIGIVEFVKLYFTNNKERTKTEYL